MKRFLTTLATAVGLWILASFTGVLADGARPEFWTTSLMWSLLAGIVIAPFYAFIQSRMFSTTESTKSVSQEMQDEDEDNTVPAFDATNTEGPPTRALDLSEIKKYASKRDEVVSA
jgi:hypothetical protein